MTENGWTSTHSLRIKGVSNPNDLNAWVPFVALELPTQLGQGNGLQTLLTIYWAGWDQDNPPAASPYEIEFVVGVGHGIAIEQVATGVYTIAQDRKGKTGLLVNIGGIAFSVVTVFLRFKNNPGLEATPILLINTTNCGGSYFNVQYGNNVTPGIPAAV